MLNFIKKILRNLILINIFLLMTFKVFSQGFTCPRGQIDCMGLCGRFTDNNNDGYCDYTIFSEATAALLKAKQDSLLSEKNKINENDISNNDKYVEKLDNSNKLDNSINLNNKEIKVNDKTDNATSQNNILKKSDDVITDNDTNIILQNNIKSESINTENKTSKPYPFLIILCSLTLLYLLSVFLVSKCVIRKCTQRRIWNSLLLITFLISGLSGLLMVAMLNYDFWLNSFMSIIKWHVIFGIAMAVISIFHLLWHIKYYKNIIFTKNLTKDCDGK